jgi:hypothetical protein
MFRRIPSDAGKRRLVVAIAAERDRVRQPVVHRVAVDVVDLERDCLSGRSRGSGARRRRTPASGALPDCRDRTG